MEDPILRLSRVEHYYGRFRALKDISLSIEQGKIIGFLGCNGAGKTTTLRIISGFTPPSSGEVELFGKSYQEDSQLNSKIGYLPERPPLYPDMRVSAYLVFCARLKGLSKQQGQERLEAIKDDFGIVEVIHRHCFKLSKGYRQRVGLAAAFIHDPPLVLLDEPTAGLDPEQSSHVRSIINGERGKRTILFSSHLLSEVQEVCERLLIIDGGEIIADDSPEGLSAELSPKRTVHCTIRLDKEDVSSFTKGLQELVLSVEVNESNEGNNVYDLVLTLSTDTSVCIEDLPAALISRGAKIRSFQEREHSVEDIFLAYISRKRSSASDVDARQGDKDNDNA